MHVSYVLKKASNINLAGLPFGILQHSYFTSSLCFECNLGSVLLFAYVGHAISFTPVLGVKISAICNKQNKQTKNKRFSVCQILILNMFQINLFSQLDVILSQISLHMYCISTVYGFI